MKRFGMLKRRDLILNYCKSDYFAQGSYVQEAIEGFGRGVESVSFQMFFSSCSCLKVSL